MNKDEVAREVFVALGGHENVLSNTVCMTRLRVTLNDPQSVDYESLGEIQGVLGTATRGRNGLEVVFGPRVIDGIYHSFIKLTGISGGVEDLFPMSRQDTNMRVQIRTSKQRAADLSAARSNKPLIDENELDVLQSIFDEREKRQTDIDSLPKRLAVINGPNINLLGLDPSKVASEADEYPGLLELCKQAAEEAGFSQCSCYQSNHEGDLVDMIQDCLDTFEAIVINPGAYEDSKALGEALQAVLVPAVDVHRHKLEQAGEVGKACLNVISGLGSEGYRVAISSLASHLA